MGGAEVLEWKICISIGVRGGDIGQCHLVENVKRKKRKKKHERERKGMKEERKRQKMKVIRGEYKPLRDCDTC